MTKLGKSDNKSLTKFVSNRHLHNLLVGLSTICGIIYKNWPMYQFSSVAQAIRVKDFVIIIFTPPYALMYIV